MTLRALAYVDGVGARTASGVDALTAIKARAPDLPVLILSSFPEEHYATTLLRQGAAGYLPAA